MRRLAFALLLSSLASWSAPLFAQSPEISLRDFASGQIKKGVRSIGFGGDGATWGNYGLVYRDEGVVLVDGGATIYDNGNTFSFTAVGATTPSLWRGLTLYAIGLAETANAIALTLHDPALGTLPLAVHGDGGDQALFVKLSMPLPHGFGIGVMLSYEVSQFAAVVDGQSSAIRFATEWRPSGGLGVVWQPIPRLLIGTRALFNNDWETRTDSAGARHGLNRSYEYRLGLSVSPWRGALLDAGATLLQRANAIAGSASLAGGANLGFEQAFWRRALVVRGGVDECTFTLGTGGCTATAGLSLRRSPVNLDLAYLYDLGSARLGTLFGHSSHSILATLTLDYGVWIRKR